MLERGAKVETFGQNGRFGYRLMTMQGDCGYMSHPVYATDEQALAAGNAAMASLHSVPLESIKAKLMSGLNGLTGSWPWRSAPGLTATNLLAAHNIWPLLEPYLLK